jgi:flagellin
MALVVANNIPALTAQRQVGAAQNNVAKSIQRLSSGLRINSPADDASGLSIAEQMKGQILGYQRAYLNAQDGLSMLQTADGALSEISNMLQRMRELAVQASSGIYTANDRNAIQMEVDQLKNEINRVSAATEFNTRKLLNGEGIASYSTDSPNAKVVMKNNVVEGNYEINLTTMPGKNAIYQTNMLTNAESSSSVDVMQGQDYVNAIHPINLPANNPITGEKLQYSFEINDNINSGSDRDKIITTASNTENSLNKLDNRLRDVEVNKSGYLLVEFNQGYPEEPVGEDTVVKDFVNLTWYDANGDATETVKAPAQFDSAGRFLGLVPNDTLHDSIIPFSGMIFPSDDFNVDLTALSAFDEGTLDLDDMDDVQAGDRVLLSISDRNSVEEDPEEYTVKLKSFSNPDVTTDIQFNQLSGTRQTFQQVEMDENGNIWTYNYMVDFSNNLDDGEVVFDVTEANAKEPVTSDTRLGEIAQFINADGAKSFTNTQQLTIYGGNGQSATINLQELDTIQDLDNKLTQAIIDMGLDSDDPTINENLVTFVDSGNKKLFDGNVVLPGSIVIQTAKPGEVGKLYFSGNENLLRGLGISTIREAEKNVVNAKVYDKYIGEPIGSEVTSDGVVRDVIQGVDVHVDPTSGLKMQWDNSVGGIVYEPLEDKVNIHLMDTRSSVHVGANPEQKIKFSIPEVDTTALGIDDLFIVDPASANDALYKLDQAQYKLNSARGMIGAQMNRLQHTLNEIDITNENMSAAESRIRDLDMAKEMTIFTKNQILSQTSTAMLAQANVMPQLVLQLLGA